MKYLLKLPYGLRAKFSYLVAGLISCLGVWIGYDKFKPPGPLSSDEVQQLTLFYLVISTLCFLISPRLLKATFLTLLPGVVWHVTQAHPDWIINMQSYAGFVQDALLGLIGPIVVLFAGFTLYEIVMEWGTTRDWFFIGKGGSARFGGSLAFLRYWIRFVKKAPLYLGTTTQKLDPSPVGRAQTIDDENHHTVLGMNGSGKSTTVIWPNLIGIGYARGLLLCWVVFLFAVWHCYTVHPTFLTWETRHDFSNPLIASLAITGLFLLLATFMHHFASLDSHWCRIFGERSGHAYPGSVFILDPKKEHFTNTAFYRRRMGQTVYLFDPNDRNGHRINFLAHIDINDPRAKQMIQSIANGCVVSASSQNETSQHFSELRLIMISGLIAHVLSTEPKSNHNLPFVYDFFLTLGEEDRFQAFIDTMRHNNTCGNLPREAALAYDRAGRNEKGSIFTTTLRNLTWISSPNMRWLLTGDDINPAVLRTELVTIYFVLDFDAMHVDKLGRFMRVALNIFIETCLRVDQPKPLSRYRTWFILDELAQLGRMAIEKHYRTLRGSNVKLSSFFQDYGGLTDVTDSPSALLANSTVQAIAVKDPDTAQVIEKYLGSYLDKGEKSTPNGQRPQGTQRSLMDAPEIIDTLRQKRNVQIVITGEGDRLFLKRKPLYPRIKHPISIKADGAV